MWLFSTIGSPLSPARAKASAGSWRSDLRVKVSETGLYTYPDVVVVCDEPRYEEPQLDTLLNPTLIVEVLSPSTEASVVIASPAA